MRENDLLEQKLRNQEDDFRLQNEALMKELAQVFCAGVMGNFSHLENSSHLHIVIK